MDCWSYLKAWRWQVMFFIFLRSWGWVCGQVRYSIVEEESPGTLVGNVAHNLGLNRGDFYERRLTLGSVGNNRYFSVNKKNGDLTVYERIDRETVCASSPRCLLYLELVAENPLELFTLEIEVLDINDNSPSFANSNQEIRITELVSAPGVQFPLEVAHDPDVGINSVSQYRLNPNPYFSLSVSNRKDGTLIPELILEKFLDREEKRQHQLILSAFDGGEQKRTGSTLVTIIVLDLNDNPPMFDQSLYKISLFENLPLTTVVFKLNATDLDEGSNGEILYSFYHHTSDTAKEIFDLNPHTGEIFIKGAVDFEEITFYELSIRARDKGTPELEGRCLIQIEVEDVNDNIPEIVFTSKTNDVPENAAIGTVVGFITVRDKDSGKNAEMFLKVSPNVPFKCQPFNNRYSLVTSGYLDREKVSKYNIILTASDLGSPSLHNQTTITLIISDVNDNAPMFLLSSYKTFIKENNEPGSLLCTVSASDPDEGDNAKLKYSIAESKIDVFSISSFVYINTENGNIYAQRSFDYEQFQVLQITVRVEDSGSPYLFSNVSVFLFILDTNDNHPTVLYPENSGEFIPQEKIPMSASAGYLVTKVSAVDLDSGRNAWLAYNLTELTSKNLFQISEYTGEIRNVRAIHETDITEQHIIISVRDQGEPPLSSTVTIYINILENVLIETHKSHDFISNSNHSPDLTLYLIISLVAICLVSLVTFIILLVKCIRNQNYDYNCNYCFLSKSTHNHYSEQYQPTLYLNTDGTLKYMEVRMAPPEPQGQCHPICFPPATEKMDFIMAKPQNISQLNQMNEEDFGSNELDQVRQRKELQYAYVLFS